MTLNATIGNLRLKYKPIPAWNLKDIDIGKKYPNSSPEYQKIHEAADLKLYWYFMEVLEKEIAIVYDQIYTN